MYLGSDAIALAPFTDAITYLEDGDWAVLTRNGVEIRDAGHAGRARGIKILGRLGLLVDKGNHRHFMAKEIHEQPEVVGHTLAHYLDMAAERVALPVELPFDFSDLERAVDLGLRHRLLRRPGRQILVRALRAPAGRDRRRLRVPLPRGAAERGGLALFVSQSGETADTLASLRYAKEQKQHMLSVVNVPTSTIARESDVVLPTLAGPEIGVASTKAFTCQLTVLACLAIAAGRARGVLSERGRAQAGARADRGAAPDGRGARARAADRALARDLAKSRDVLYLGRGTCYPLALEGALKLKEISYIHAEGYAAGELKHGPIALIDETDAGDRDRAARPGVREDRLQHAGGRGARRQDHPDHRRQGRARGRPRHAGDDRAAADARLGRADRLCPSGAAPRLSHGGVHGHRRRPAAQE